MPTYSYKCTECGHSYEVRQRYSDEPLTVCPVCEGRIRRVISPVGIVFKGSGFYVTDNRNGKVKSKVNGDGKKRKEKESTSNKSEDKQTNVASTKKDADSTAAGSGA
jgi:putative FmdB family regulatory protein